MALKDLLIQNTQDLQCGDTTITAYALSVEDISNLLETNSKEISGLLSGDVNIAGILKKAPEFVSRVIALGLKEPEGEAGIKTLPFGIQIRLLEAIWNLSVVDVDYMGKFLSRLVKGLTEAAQKLPKEIETPETPESNGSLPSAESLRALSQKDTVSPT